MRLSKFIVLIYGIRELLWFPFKSANFPKIYNTRYGKGKYSKSFLWIYNLATVNNITADKGIITGKNY